MRPFLFTVMLLLTALANAEDDTGARFKSDLLVLIDRADHVVVSEHSDPADALDFDAFESRIKTEIVYGQRDLNRRQFKLLRTTVAGIKPEPASGGPACIIEVHHSFKFYRQGKLISTMDLCFHCGQVRWPDTTGTAPDALFKAMAGFVKAIGFAPQRNWYALANAHLPPKPNRPASVPNNASPPP